MIYLLTFSLLLLTVLVLTIAISARYRIWILALIIPFLVFNIGFTYHTVQELWGYPVKGYPQGEVELLASKIEKPDVLIVVRYPDGRTRLHQIPYTKRDEEQLSSANRELRKGRRIMMNNRGQAQESRFELYPWKPSEMMPKEAQ